MSQIYKCHKSPDLVANSFDASTGVVEATGILSLRQAWAIQRVFLKQTTTKSTGQVCALMFHWHRLCEYRDHGSIVLSENTALLLFSTSTSIRRHFLDHFSSPVFKSNLSLLRFNSLTIHRAHF